MNTYTYIPRFVCSREINFGIEDGKLHNVKFKGGCDGNLKAISSLVEGLTAEEITEKLRSALGLHATVRLVKPNSIIRSEGKAKRVIDMRQGKM